MTFKVNNDGRRFTPASNYYPLAILDIVQEAKPFLSGFGSCKELFHLYKQMYFKLLSPSR